MKALIKLQLNLMPGKSGDDSAYIVFAEKDISVPELPQVGMRIEGFQIFKDFEELMYEDRKQGRLNELHGFEIRHTEFELKGDVMVPVIWLWEDYEKFCGGYSPDDDVWEDLDAEQAFEQLFKPQLDKYKFRITYNPFRK